MMKTRKLTLTAIFLAIILLFAFTPFGFINLGFIKATLIHIPVIIGSIVLGPQVGAFLGLTFGLTSLAVNTFTPSILSFAFSPFIPVIGTMDGSLWALVISLVPRVLVGVFPYFVYRFFQDRIKHHPKLEYPVLFGAGLVGSLTNTILVMNLIFLVFKDAYGAAREIPSGQGIYQAVLTVILINGVPEAIVAGIATAAVTGTLLKINQRKG